MRDGSDMEFPLFYYSLKYTAGVRVCRFIFPYFLTKMLLYLSFFKPAFCIFAIQAPQFLPVK